jgi:hypothetical protein
MITGVQPKLSDKFKGKIIQSFENAETGYLIKVKL